VGGFFVGWLIKSGIVENISRLSSAPNLRQIAEKRMSHTDEAALNASVDELLQELRVHQIELEMQNEALRQTQLALEESLNRYVSLYDFAPVGYLTLTENGTIAEANLIGADLLGESRTTFIKQRFPRFIVPEDSDRWHQHFYCMKQHGKSKSCEVRMCRSDGSLFYARLDCLLLGSVNHATESQEPNLIAQTLSPINTNGLMMRVVLTDVTEMKMVEQELRVAATVFESQEGMMVTDAKSVILKVNHAFTNITGYTAEEAVGKTPHLLSSGRHEVEFYIAMWSRIHSTGTWQGEIFNRRKNGEIFPQWLTITAVKGGDGTVTHYVATLTDITARKAAEEEMHLLAFYDSLTRLPNRRLLLDRLQRAMITSARTRQYCALMFVDLDNFKSLNDSLGHDVGDLMLQLVAQRLALCVREGDTVSRIGGDEFLVMLENLNENAQEASSLAETIGQKILAAINQPFQLSGHVCLSTASIGITLFINHVYTVAEIQKQADIAMYEAKSVGRNEVRFFKPEFVDLPCATRNM
jgi:diguanylate cyclase (GGDEF)-like protein/PAS domain S-box-containing protein